MKKLWFVPLVVMSLSGCMPLLSALLSGGSTPAPQAVQTISAPLAHTTIDESSFRAALAGARALNASIRVVIARGGLVRNSPSALAVQRGLIALQSALRVGRSLLDALNDPATTLSAAELARKAGEYRQVMADAERASEDISDALAH